MDNKTPTHDDLIGMNDAQLQTLGYKRKMLAGGAIAIQKIQEGPRKIVAKLEEIHPDSIIMDAVFPPKSKANDFSLLAGYFLEQVLGQYISRIQSTGLLRDTDIQSIIEILEYYNLLRIKDYLLSLSAHNPDNKLSMRYSQLPERIKLDERVKVVSEVVSGLKYKLESWQQAQR